MLRDKLTAKGPVTKTDNHRAAFDAKVELRRRVLDAMAPARVFDAFAGLGEMHRAVWHLADHYVGCDLRWANDARPAFVADNRRVLRAVDLREFNVFDFDAYGSPWEQVVILADRRPLLPGETIGLVITEGSGLKIKFGALPRPMALLAGMNTYVPGLAQAQDDLWRK